MSRPRLDLSAFEHRYGKEPDHAIAADAGVSVSLIQRRRHELRIPAYQPTWKERTGKKKGVRWDTQPLGKLADDALAARLGVSRQTVHRARKARGIPPWASRKIGGD